MYPKRYQVKSKALNEFIRGTVLLYTQVLYEKEIKLEISGNEVDYAACSLPVILNNSWSKPHSMYFTGDIKGFME